MPGRVQPALGQPVTNQGSMSEKAQLPCFGAGWVFSKTQMPQCWKEQSKAALCGTLPQVAPCLASNPFLSGFLPSLPGFPWASPPEVMGTRILTSGLEGGEPGPGQNLRDSPTYLLFKHFSLHTHLKGKKACTPALRILKWISKFFFIMSWSSWKGCNLWHIVKSDM